MVLGTRRPALLLLCALLDSLLTAGLGSQGTHILEHLSLGWWSTYNLGDTTNDLMLVSLLRLVSVVALLISTHCAAPKASSLQLQEPLLGEDEESSDEGARRRVRRCQIVTRSVWLIGVLLVCTKCLYRLVVGAPEEHSTGAWWFWGCIAVSLLSPLLQHTFMLRSLSSLGDTAAAEVQAAQKSQEVKSVTVWDLMKMCSPDWRLFIVAYSALIIAAAGESVIPFLFGLIIDSIALEDNVADFHRYMLYLVLTAGVTGVFTGVRGSTFIVVGARFSVRLREMLFKSLVSQEVAFFDVHKSGDVSSRLNADCQKVGDQVTLNVNVFLRSLLQVVFTLCFMFVISPRLALTAFVSVPCIVYVSKVFGDYMKKLSKATQDSLADANAVAEQCISNMTTVKSFAAEEYEFQRYRVEMERYLHCNVLQAKAYFFFSSLTFTFLPQCTSCLVLFYAGKLVQEPDRLKASALVSFVFYMQSLFAAYNSLGSIYTGLVTAVGAADKVFEWLRREPALLPHSDAVTPLECRGEISLQGIQFRYPTRPDSLILNNLNIHAKPGEVIALCGPSGGGKSSCIGLLEDWYRPEKGAVTLDGVPLERLNSAWRHQRMVLVGQEPVLFARSIGENILYGELPEGTGHEEMVKAATLANAHGFISELKDGYDTQVGDRGAQLSGGQKQRIAIARALVRNPRVLLLDEATSALDAESEFIVQEAIDSMIAAGGMTVVVIAHRLSTIKNANNILVIKNGQVVEQGPHNQLLEQKGEYHKLVTRQMLSSSTNDLQAASCNSIEIN